MNLLMWVSAMLAGFGGGVFGSFFLEAYYQRIEHNKVYDHDIEMQ